MHQQLDLTALLIATALGIALPVCIIFMRQSVKLQRQQLIKDLEDIFYRVPVREGQDQVIPSFEFVKFKYFMETLPQGRLNSTQDIPTRVLLGASVPLIACLLILGYIAVSTMLSGAIAEYLPAYFRFDRYPGAGQGDLRTWNEAFAIAYVGSYLFVVRDLLCSVENFDLGPARMLASALHVLFGVATAVLITIGWTALFPADKMQAVKIPIFIAAFAVGYIPELGLRSLLRASKLRLFKRDDENVYKAFKSTPLEIIDGIDSEIRSRLKEFNVATVQHLATANPVMLFVETPYGVYQIFDWVCQAQLCAAVGSRTFAALNKIGIRTIFDLERVTLDPRISTPHIRHEIGRLIVESLDAEGRIQLGLTSTNAHTAESDRSVVAFVAVAVDDLHVQRLRQIYNCVSERLGHENTRLDFVARPYVKKRHYSRRRGKSPATGRPKVEIVASSSDGKNGGTLKVSAIP